MLLVQVSLLQQKKRVRTRIASELSLSPGTKEDAGYRRGCLSSNKRKNPERDLAPGPCLC